MDVSTIPPSLSLERFSAECDSTQNIFIYFYLLLNNIVSENLILREVERSSFEGVYRLI